MYLIRLTLRPWRVAPASQFLSTLAVGALILLSGFLLWVESNLRQVGTRLQTDQVITAYLDPVLESKDRLRVTDAIRVQLGAQAQVKLVEASQVIQGLSKEYPQLGRELEAMGEGAQSVVPAYVSAAGTFAADTLQKIRSVVGVESAESSKDRYAAVGGAVRALGWVVRMLLAGLCLAIFVGLVHLTRMNAHLHRDTLPLLRLWGAGPFVTRAPVIASALCVGLMGGLFAATAWGLGAGWLGAKIAALSPVLSAMGDLNSVWTGPHSMVAMAAMGIFMGAFAGVVTASERAPDRSYER